MTNIVIKQRTLPLNVELPSISHPLLKRLYIARGITADEQLNHSTQALLNYNQLLGINEAVAILYQAVDKQEKVLIVGDFDTDGATSTALIITALKQFGIKNVSYIIPDRFEDGYGLSISIIKKAIEQNAQLIVTVDNGVSAVDAVDYAKQHNIKVIITDHHLAPNELPRADAIINPNLSNCQFPSKNLAGVGVTFYFMLAFRTYLRQQGWFKKNNLTEFNLANLLDLVALGTIADVVHLDHNNRILVQQGLSRIRAGYCCLGIKALITLTQKDIQTMTAQNLAYYLSPRINAAGRMENMSLGVELLLTQDEHIAFELAETLETLNTERKNIEKNMLQDALSFIQEMEKSLQEVPNSFVIHHTTFHQGVIGIVSSRIKEKFHRPVISFANVEDGYLKGSGRSIHGIHLRDVLEKINTQSPKLITHFGGHAMAVGLTIKESNLVEFRQCFEDIITTLPNVNYENIIETDGSIDNEFFNIATAKVLRDAGPWGENFPEPIFDGIFYVHQQKLVGKNHLKIVLEPIETGPLVNGIAFNIDPILWPNQSVKKIHIAYQLELNEFRGNQSINLLIRHLQAVD